MIFRDFHKLDLKEFEKEIGAYRVVANLPYYITTPLIAKLLDESELCEGVSVMVQEEVADVSAQKENTPEYGAITAGIALKGTAKIVKRVPAPSFIPGPNVDSAVVKIEFERDRLFVKDRKMYRDTVRCAFLNRRKTLQNNLMISFSLSREQAKEVLQKAGSTKKRAGKRFLRKGWRRFRTFCGNTTARGEKSGWEIKMTPKEIFKSLQETRAYEKSEMTPLRWKLNYVVIPCMLVFFIACVTAGRGAAGKGRA